MSRRNRPEVRHCAGGERIMLPRLGAHISAWGHGHTCDSPDQPHDGPCVCACGVVQPYDQPIPDQP